MVKVKVKVKTFTSRLVRIEEAARLANKNPRQFRRTLLAMHARDREEGADLDWLVRPANRWLYVNLDLLAAAHPALFGHEAPSQNQVEEHEERIDDLEKRIVDLTKRVNAQGARIRELESR